MANETARSLRKNMTPQEVKLWVNLRNLKADGFHFRRQAPIGPFIVDFAEKTARLVIEVDGAQHGHAANLIADAKRDQYLQNNGYRVLRFWNNDVDQELNGVMTKILETLSNPSPQAERD